MPASAVAICRGLSEGRASPPPGPYHLIVTSESQPNGAWDLPQDLTPREGELLRQAGDRVFALSRKLADANKLIEMLKVQMGHTDELLAETRRARDILSDQVASLLRERDRDYEERAELRKLLASMQFFITSVVNTQARFALLETRTSPQRGASGVPAPGTPRSLDAAPSRPS
jgi:hypothetical protein